jgi:hypothetical protein
MKHYANPYDDESPSVRLSKRGAIIPYALIPVLLFGGSAYHFLEVAPSQSDHDRRLSVLESSQIAQDSQIRAVELDNAAIKAQLVAIQDSLVRIEGDEKAVEKYIYAQPDDLHPRNR